MIYLIGIIISSFLLFLLFLKKKKSQAENILSAWIGLTLIHQVVFYLEHTDLIYEYPHLLGASFPLPLLHGLCLFFYVKAMISPRPFLINGYLPHFIPFLILIVLAIPFYSLSIEDKIYVFEYGGEGFEWYVMLKLLMIPISGLSYVIASLASIHTYRKVLKRVFSNTEKKNLRWLELLSHGLGFIWLLAIFFNDEIIFLGVVGLVLFIGFYGINQISVFSAYDQPIFDYEQRTSAFLNKNSPDKENRYAKSGLTKEESKRVYLRLSHMMQEESLYKINELSLAELANRLAIHPNYLSQVINEWEQKNFYNYINSLRVEEFIRAASLPENNRYTFLALAHECGFNSKSTFNKYFKKYTLKTPSEYFAS